MKITTKAVVISFQCEAIFSNAASRLPFSSSSDSGTKSRYAAPARKINPTMRSFQCTGTSVSSDPAATARIIWRVRVVDERDNAPRRVGQRVGRELREHLVPSRRHQSPHTRAGLGVARQDTQEGRRVL